MLPQGPNALRRELQDDDVQRQNAQPHFCFRLRRHAAGQFNVADDADPYGTRLLWLKPGL